MKKKIMSVLLASALCVSIVLPATATGTDQTPGVEPYKVGTDVYAGVVTDNEVEEIGGDPKIRVEVPTMFAFVVNGTRLNKHKDAPLTMDEVLDPSDPSGKTVLVERSILVPNYTVEVGAPGKDGNHRSYSLEVTANSEMLFKNFSTKKNSDTPTGREGIQVDIYGYIQNEGTLKSRNYWEHVSKIIPEATNQSAGARKIEQFKKYKLSVNEIPFDESKMEPLIGFDDVQVERFYMSKKIRLQAPRADIAGNCDVESNWFSRSPASSEIKFGVEIGGLRGDYTQIEQSAKIGTIVWTASYTYTNDGTGTEPAIPTAPDKPYLQNPERLSPYGIHPDDRP